mgnify:CR=1 FL=1
MYRGADAGTDHYLVIGMFKARTANAKKTVVGQRRCSDISKLENKAMKNHLGIELKNRFAAQWM